MKRSEINKALKNLEDMCKKYSFSLPPFCHFTPEEWQTKGHEYDEVRDCMLGWDITDFGLGDFNKVGFSLITIRNGNRKMTDKYPKVYAEKLLYLTNNPQLVKEVGENAYKTLYRTWQDVAEEALEKYKKIIEEF